MSIKKSVASFLILSFHHPHILEPSNHHYHNTTTTMATYTLYDASIGTGKDILNSLSAIVAKAESSSAASSIPKASTHPDMLPFTFQVFVTTATVAKMIARVTGTEPVEMENNLETFDAMKARIAEVQKMLEGVSRDTVNGRENEIVPVGLGKGKPDGKLKSWQYVHGYAVPNIYFHLTTAYNIARKEGVEIGKMDYLVPFMGKFLEGQM